MGRLLFIAFAALVIVLAVVIISKINSPGKKTDEENQSEFMSEIEEVGKRKSKEG